MNKRKRRIAKVMLNKIAAFVFTLFILLILPAQAQAAHHAALTWIQSIDPVSLNCIARGATSGSESFTSPVFCSTTPITNYTDTTVAGGSTYYYEVDAVGANGVASLPS